MSNLNREILKVVDKLNDYYEVGYMNKKDIALIIEEIKRVFNEENVNQYNRMMEDITQYYTSLNQMDLSFDQYVRFNIDEVAKLLNKSVRTVYRKLQNQTFTLYEKKLIIKKMNADNN